MKLNKNFGMGIFSALALGATAQAADVKVSGYVDAGYNWAGKAAAGTGLGKENAFALNEGAVTFSGNMESAVGVLDYNYVDNKIDEAYVGYNADSGFGLKLGQMKSVLGFEGTDSTTRHFARSGLIYETLFSGRAGGVKKYNTGALFSFKASDDLKFSATAVNYDDGTAGVQPFSNPGYGFKIESNMGSMKAEASGMFQGTEAGESGYTLGLGVSSEFGDTHVSAELAFMKAALANAESGLAAGVAAGQNFSEDTSAHISFEWANGKASGAVGRAYSLLRAGPRFQMTEAMHVDLTYAMVMATAPAGFVKVKSRHEGHLAAVYAF